MDYGDGMEKEGREGYPTPPGNTLCTWLDFNPVDPVSYEDTTLTYEGLALSQ